MHPGLTVMVDLPAFLPNLSSSGRVTFFWATICKSEASGREGQAGTAPDPGDPTAPSPGLSGLCCLPAPHHRLPCPGPGAPFAAALKHLPSLCVATPARPPPHGASSRLGEAEVIPPIYQVRKQAQVEAR